MEKLGIDMVVDAPARLPQLNAVRVPQGIDDAATRKRLLDRYGLEIGAGLGDFAGKIWRIGLMGQACKEEYVDQCLQILAKELS